MLEKRNRFLCLISVAALFLVCVASVNAADPPRPNIILIMADDLGYSDLGCYGGEIATPNLDKLAETGMRFTHFYNNARCWPTRASLLTGQYSQAVHEHTMVHGATFGEILRPAGYRTLCSGKWHNRPLPTDRGFDRYYGLADGCCNFFNPGTEARPGEPKPGRKRNSKRRWAIEGEVIMGYTSPDKKFYTTDAFTDYALDRLEEYKSEFTAKGKERKPFVLYLAYTAPHYPLHAWPEDIAKYSETYKVGWDKIAAERYKKMVKIGIFDGKYKAAGRDNNVPAWNTLSKEKKAEAALAMSVYAAMIDRMDQNIGRVVKKVDALGIRNETLILFLADNGGCAEKVDKTPDIPPGPVGGYRTLGKPWANACNTPFRMYKSDDYEGGACTPMIANWPSVIKPGTVTEQVGHIIDFVPTFAELAGAEIPETRNSIDGDKEIKLKKVTGKSLVPIFEGKKREGHKLLFFAHSGNRAVRKGDWKAVSPKGNKKEWELYNLAQDRTELNNVAKENPELTKELADAWEAWSKECEEKP